MCKGGRSQDREHSSKDKCPNTERSIQENTNRQRTRRLRRMLLRNKENAVNLRPVELGYIYTGPGCQR